MVSLFTSQVPAATDGTDGVAYSLGTVFETSAPGQVTHIRWRFPDTLPSGTVTGALYEWDSDATGTLLASATFSSPTAGTWNTVAITPQTITPGARYVAVIHTPDRYVASNGFFSTALTNAPLTAPADSGSVHNGKLSSGGSLQYPDGSFGSASYFADVVFVEDGGTEVPVDQAPETDTAQPLGRLKALGFLAATEMDTARPLGSAKAATAVQAAENDAASPIGAAKTTTVGTAGETDTAAPITAAKSLPVGQASETGDAFPVGAGQSFPVGSAAEADTAVPVKPVKTRTLGRADEVDTAFALAAVKRITLGLATETDIAAAAGSAKALTVSPAAETDVAFAVDARSPIRITLGVAAETDTAQPTTPLGADVAFYDGPCQPWDPIWTCKLDDLSPAVTGSALAVATELLWVRSGRRFGVCEVVLRPCRDGCAGGQTVDGWWQWDGQPRPRFYKGVWTNVTCGSCTSGCSCSVVSEVTLPSPVADIVEVRIDGVVLDPAAYRVDDYRKLVRVDGGEWPDCNDLSRDDGAAGTWSVTAEIGEEVPHAGRLAVGELAVEIGKAIACDSTCALPSSLQSLSRAGVNLNFIDPNTVYDGGRLGLRFCDLFLSTYNPGNLADDSRVHRIDQPRPRVRTL